MTAASLSERNNGSAKIRLIHAADAEIADRGIDGVQMAAIARRAGVSRATAFRQLGSISETLVQVGLLRADRNLDAVRRLMDAKAGVFDKLEVAFVYNARELPKDPAIAALMAQRSASVHDPRVHGAALKAVGPVIEKGQRNGEIRTDLSLDTLVDFLVEQTYLAAEEIDRSEAAVRNRVRHFVVPAIEARGARGGEFVSRTREVESAISAAVDALQTLSGQLRQPH